MAERAKTLAEKIADAAPAPWVVEMRKHYQRTGTYRPEDLQRLLGAQSRPDGLRERLERAARNSAPKTY